jgi:hypothetical protein
MSLTDDGLTLVESITGEALDNAETHSDLIKEDGSWTVAGFMTGPERHFRLHLSFLSLGATVAESVAECPEPIRTGMEAYVNRHARVRNNLTAPDLRTVYALQDGVTRLGRKLEGGAKGGTGLADVIEFFSSLASAGEGADPPKLAIVSGSTYIGIGSPYDHALRESVPGVAPGETLPRRLWFNRPNSETLPPDADHVYSLPASIKGTLVTMAFDLEQRFLEGSSDDDDRSDRPNSRRSD